MADTKVEIVEKEEEEENEFDINEFLAPENKRMFTTKDYINVAPGFNPTDYFISANYKPIDFAQTNAEIVKLLSRFSYTFVNYKPCICRYF